MGRQIPERAANHVGWQGRITLQKKRSPIPPYALQVVIQAEVVMTKARAKGGEKSEQGIVVRKLVGKAAMASDSVQGY